MNHQEATEYLQQIHNHVFGAGTKATAPASGQRINFPNTGNAGKTWFIIDGDKLWAVSDQGFESLLARYLTVSAVQIEKLQTVANALETN